MARTKQTSRGKGVTVCQGTPTTYPGGSKGQKIVTNPGGVNWTNRTATLARA